MQMSLALQQDASPQTFCDRLEAYFRERPGQWIDGIDLSRVAGTYAWRSRISNLRIQRGMVIKNRQTREVGFGGQVYVCSEYCFVPEGK